MIDFAVRCLLSDDGLDCYVWASAAGLSSEITLL